MCIRDRFDIDGVELEFTESAVACIAKEAAKKKSGARGLRAIVERVLLDVMYEMPTLDGLCKVVVDNTVVSDGCEPLFIYNRTAPLLEDSPESSLGGS